MKITKVSVGKGIKLSIDYNTVSADILLEAELDEGDNLEQVFSQLSSMVEQALDLEIESQILLLKSKSYR